MRLRAELAAAAALIGTIIGAGFASGQELVQFFLSVGPRAPAAVVLTGILFGLTAGVVRYLALQRKTASYEDFLAVFGMRWQAPADVVVASFLFGGLVIMLAGSGAVAKQYFGLWSMTGIIASSALAFAGSQGRGRGLILINTLLVPVMLGILVGMTVLFYPESVDYTGLPPAGGLISGNWVLNAFLYAAYNMVGATVLLTSLPGSNRGVLGAVLGGLFIGVLAFYLIRVLAGLPPAGLHVELPLLYMAAASSPKLVSIYAIALWLAMVTTAAGILYGLVTRVVQFGYFTPVQAAAAILIIAVPVATCGFGRLVSYIYPFYGYLCLILLIVVAARRLIRVIFKQEF